MKPRVCSTVLMLSLALGSQAVRAQSNTPPVTPAEIEALYATTLEDRAVEIIKAADLTDPAVIHMVHDLVIAHYRVMRARDALIDAQLRALGKDVTFANRADRLQAESKTLHDYFFARLGEKLTPAQVEVIKDKMTYNKVKVTYDAYCQIIPGLTDAEKAKILDLLKTAREEAVDGGSAPEKTAIFQKYKDQINASLKAGGHDVDKAFADWTAKQATARNETK